MKKSRFSDEQIIGFLRQAEAGMGIPELCRSGGFSQGTFYKWRAKFGGCWPRPTWTSTPSRASSG